MIRITGGEARGRTVPSPHEEGVRPTASKIRQAFFNILGAKTADADFLDIFAGTGLMGLEAASRGARSVTSIEENRRMGKAIESCFHHLGYEPSVIVGDFRKILSNFQPDAFDIIYADPPYQSRFAASVTELVDKLGLLRVSGIFAVEHARTIQFGDNYTALKYKDT